jgi:hypothetical protein
MCRKGVFAKADWEDCSGGEGGAKQAIDEGVGNGRFQIDATASSVMDRRRVALAGEGVVLLSAAMQW